ncbi:MAG TPA: hypothetical protein VLA04_01835, partial [Verrucomicrobiae bacterium]|nr:hypothetical protein [Verrucomicrobiae bacterium]
MALTLLGHIVALGASADPLPSTTRAALLKYATHWQVPQPSPKATLIKIWVFQSESADNYALG